MYFRKHTVFVQTHVVCDLLKITIKLPKQGTGGPAVLGHLDEFALTLDCKGQAKYFLKFLIISQNKGNIRI